MCYKHLASRPMLYDAVSCPFQFPWKPKLPEQSRRLIKHLGKKKRKKYLHPSSSLFALNNQFAWSHSTLLPSPPDECRLHLVSPPAGALHSVAQVNGDVQHCPRASEPRRSVQEELMRDTLRTCCLLWHHPTIPLPRHPPPAAHTHTSTHSLKPHASLDTE